LVCESHRASGLVSQRQETKDNRQLPTELTLPRIFFSLAVTSLILIATALTYGLLGGDYNGISRQLRDLQSASAAAQNDTATERFDEKREAILARLKPIQNHVRIHMLLGILASLVSILVQSIGVTYFIGTGRWCKEVVEAYDFDGRLVQQSTKLKRQAFPFAMLGIAVVLTISALGAAADPGTLRETTANYVRPHLWAGMIGMGVVAIALWMQASAIRRNQALIESILQRVKEVRQSRGLEV
jgi:hypothetical protein